WASVWATYPASNTNAVTSYVSGWNGAWQGPVQLTPPNNLQTGDVNLSWDSVRQRFVFALLDFGSFANPNIWYGYSTDSSGSQWVFGNKDGNGVPQPVFSASGSDWDYPSIGVDSTGRVIIGGVNFAPVGLYSVVSTDGEHFSSPSALPLSGGGVDLGAQSRVVAAGGTFHAFVPSLNGQFLPTSVSRYESADGTNWSGPFSVANFDPPLNSAQPSGANLPLFYAPLLSAAGYTDGRWIVGFQIANGGWNNMEICTSDRGCGLVNAGADDQFLAGVSVSADGYWAAYHTYSTLGSRSLPLITQAIYFPTGSAAVGATTNTNIDPTSWAVAGVSGQSPPPRCGGQCYASGDYNTPSSNPFAASHTTFVQSSSRRDDLFQSFQQDPQGTPNVRNFKPNFVAHRLGVNLASRLPIPIPPESQALSPRIARGFRTRF
ncbi:MAG TPA: hypothetical protein VG488_11180, partial [Candidatus Angelobacter sp.]|nr:hypothetical protein [Candidatus Angelobacter sp.]